MMVSKTRGRRKVTTLATRLGGHFRSGDGGVMFTTLTSGGLSGVVNGLSSTTSHVAFARFRFPETTTTRSLCGLDGGDEERFRAS